MRCSTFFVQLLTYMHAVITSYNSYLFYLYHMTTMMHVLKIRMQSATL